MKYELAVFDFDGTLADSYPWFIRNINDVADKFGFRRVAEQEIETLRTMDARRIIEHLEVPMWKMPFLTRDIRRRMANEVEQIRLFPGVGEVMKQLKNAGVKISMVTSNSRTNVEKVLGVENANLIEYYECGVSLFGKEAKIRKVLRRSNVQPEKAILIGDELRDLQAAHAEQIAFGAVIWGYTNADAFTVHTPEKVFKTMSEIAVFLTSS
jgi:phosphoglycolate phosphatase